VSKDRLQPLALRVKFSFLDVAVERRVRGNEGKSSGNCNEVHSLTSYS
jgi:hypothetical protein